MSAADALKTFFGVLAVLVGIPVILLAIKIGRFSGSIEAAVKSLEKSATAFSDRVDVMLEKLCEEVGDHETRLRLLEERRKSRERE